jgi:Protein of unknown function (DUF3379)
MNNSHFKDHLGAQPKNTALAQAARDLVESGENPDAVQQLALAISFESEIERALALSVPDQLSARLLAIASTEVPQIQTRMIARRKNAWLAIAASVSACALLAGTWAWTNRSALEMQLAADCVDHLAHEPFALTRTTRVPPALVSQLFVKSGLAIDGNLVVNYLQPCIVNGQLALHIVIQQSSGPVTVMILPTAKSIADLERTVGQAQVRVRGFEGGGLVFLAESSRDFDAVEAKLLAGLRVQRIQNTG